MMSPRDQARQDSGRDRHRPVRLFYGPEEFLKEQAVQEILRELVPPELREFNLDVLYGDETDAGTIVDRVASLPMMAERRVVLVRNVDRLPIEERRKILEYSVSSEKRKLLNKLEREIAQLGRRDELPRRRKTLLEQKRKVLKGLAFAFPHACLLLTAADGDVVKMFHRGGRKKKAPGRKAPKAKNVSRPSQHVGSRSAAEPGGGDSQDEPWLNVFADRVVAGKKFPTPSGIKVQEWVRRLARDRGKSISPPAVRLLIQAVGSDLVALNNELAKLSIYIADRPQIDPDDIEMVVGEMKVRSVWDLCDTVVSGQPAQAISLLGRLLESGLAVPQLTGALRSRLSGMVSRGGRGRAGTRARIAQDRLEKAFELLYDTELSFLTGRQSARMAMTLLIDRLGHLFVSEEK